MRLIDADALLEELPVHPNGGMRSVKNECLMIRVRGTIENAPTIGGWISVKERLPERYERILTYDKYHGVKENWLLRSSPGVSWSYGFHVTHWMPLPEPPKEVKQND